MCEYNNKKKKQRNKRNVSEPLHGLNGKSSEGLVHNPQIQGIGQGLKEAC
jgi:hypothetical protein